MTERGRASELLSAPRGLLYTEQAPNIGIRGSNRAYGFYLLKSLASSTFCLFHLLPRNGVLSL